MYTVLYGEQEKQFETRQKAINVARDKSENWGGDVEVEGPKSKELLRYRRGELTFYLFETRRGRTVRH